MGQIGSGIHRDLEPVAGSQAPGTHDPCGDLGAGRMLTDPRFALAGRLGVWIRRRPERPSRDIGIWELSSLRLSASLGNDRSPQVATGSRLRAFSSQASTRGFAIDSEGDFL